MRSQQTDAMAVVDAPLIVYGPHVVRPADRPVKVRNYRWCHPLSLERQQSVAKLVQSADHYRPHGVVDPQSRCRASSLSAASPKCGPGRGLVGELLLGPAMAQVGAVV